MIKCSSTSTGNRTSRCRRGWRGCMIGVDVLIRQTERVNQCMETYLRCFIHACPRQWSQWLSLVEYWYNTSSHLALGRSPFEVLYGCQPRHLGLDISSAAPVPEIQQWLSDRDLMQRLVHQHLERAQLRMKKQAYKHRSERTFNVGDWVFLKLHPYVQSSVAT